jgi:ribonuclease D
LTDLSAPDAPVETSVAPVELLTMPSGGLPALIDSSAGLRATGDLLRAGSGPLAVDTERAHGFRYSQRAYLIQLRRAGSGTHLIDPIAFGTPADLSGLGAAVVEAEWIIHAASQDLPCLFEVGLVPRQLFDTELAARLLNYPRVALGTMLEELFSVRLLKEHSASDWSTRPIPREWLTYAALDVELMVELRDALAAQLEAAGKLDWARQEFAALVAGAGMLPERRPDPWRRTSGIHKVRTRRGLAYVAALWHERDDIAQQQDRAPGRILSDVAITDLAAVSRPDRTTLRHHPAFGRRQAKRYEANWLDAVARATILGESELPPMHIASDGPPQARMWAAKDPVAAARLARGREVVAEVAERVSVPVENLITPDHLRRLAWRPPTPITPETVEAALISLGARAWQRDLVVAPLTPALGDAAQ